MDIAAMSVVMANHKVREDASLAVMNRVKDLMGQQGQQLMEMLQQSGPVASHPTLGSTVDLKV